MASMPEHAHRASMHRQPARVPDTHWGVGTTGDLHAGADPRGCPDCCAHEWLDRPESDTRMCLICGEEA